MDTGTIILLIVIMVIMKIFAIRYGAKSIAHLIDHWMTTIFDKKRLEKKAFRQGFFELYQKELEFRSNGLITQMQCHYAFGTAQYKHKDIT